MKPEKEKDRKLYNIPIKYTHTHTHTHYTLYIYNTTHTHCQQPPNCHSWKHGHCLLWLSLFPPAFLDPHPQLLVVQPKICIKSFYTHPSLQVNLLILITITSCLGFPSNFSPCLHCKRFICPVCFTTHLLNSEDVQEHKESILPSHGAQKTKPIQRRGRQGPSTGN